ncbi:leucine-rich repeat-containing protein 47-like [Amia ocellicauda]|uniref:leucine-rich repeat-containing protein 47-like n=1 Tax=Amia ocellicauda TaxID=2972642 RepID=UPI003463C1D6
MSTTHMVLLDFIARIQVRPTDVPYKMQTVCLPVHDTLLRGDPGASYMFRDKEECQEKDQKKKNDKRQKNKKEDEGVDDLMVVRVLHLSESPTVVMVKVTAAVKDVRPYIVCCTVKGMNLKAGNLLKRFLTAQIKLHDEICEKRTAATIATHDLSLIKGPLLYDARPPKTLQVI